MSQAMDECGSSHDRQKCNMHKKHTHPYLLCDFILRLPVAVNKILHTSRNKTSIDE